MGKPGKPSRSATSGGRSGRSRPNTGGARTRHQARTRTRDAPGRPRISWSRRLGAGLALALLGTSIVLAGQVLDAPPAVPGKSVVPGSSVAAGSPPGGSSSSASARPSSEPTAALAAPALEPPDLSLVAAAAIDVSGTLPAGLPRDGTVDLRVYVNDVLERQRRLPDRDEFVVRSVPLRQGENQIVAVLHSSDGEGHRSAALVVTRDDVAPRIRLDEPSRGATITEDDVTLAGTTEPGALLTVANATNSREVSTTADDEGSFAVSIGVDAGPNVLTMIAVDAAGNRGREELTVTAGESSAQVSLTVSDETISLSRLPATVTLTVHVFGEDGAPVDGADVTFSLSQPGQPTVTYRAASDDGTAEWRNVRLPRGGARAGQGFATAMVVLPAGTTLQASATFTVR